MASSRNLVHVLVLLIATGLLTAVPANSAQHNLIEASAAGNLARVKALLAANDIGRCERQEQRWIHGVDDCFAE